MKEMCVRKRKSLKILTSLETTPHAFLSIKKWLPTLLCLLLVGQAVIAGEIFNWVNDATCWSEVEGMPAPRYFFSAAELNGALYLVGGVSGAGVESNVYRFTGSTWQEVSGLPSPRYSSGVANYNGNLYVAGGKNESWATRTNMYRYDGMDWTEVEGLPAARDSLAAASLNGYLYCLGGQFGEPCTNVYRYDGANWSEVAGLPAPRFGHGAETLNNRIYVIGGGIDSTALTNVYAFNGTNWTEVAGLPAGKRYYGLAKMDNALYATAGNGGGTNVFKFDGANWVETAGLPAQRYGLAAGTLDGATYAVGGFYLSAPQTNAFRYPGYVRGSGVTPSFGVRTGGYLVVISGTDLGNGSDITSVTICGVEVSSIVSQSATQVVVMAGVGVLGTGDVRVQSDSAGESVREGGFTYVTSSQTLTFPPIARQTANHTVGLSATASSGLPVSFAVGSGSASIAQGTNLSFSGGGQVSIIASQAGDLDWSVAPDVTNTFDVLQFTSYAGPDNGVGSLTINWPNLGNGGDITNVWVGGIAASITGQGSHFVTIALPAHAAGLVDIVVQSASAGPTTFAGSFTYNLTGTVYDNVTEGWRQTAGLPAPRIQVGAGVLNGKLYAVGGWNGSYAAQSNVYRFDETTWTEVAPLPFARDSVAVETYEGYLYAIGGDSSGDKTNVFRFDGASWSQVAGLPAPRQRMSAKALGSNLYAMGGTSVSNVYRYNVTNWVQVAPLPTNRMSMASGVLNEYLYVAGGDSGPGIPWTNAYRFNGSDWTEARGLPKPLRNMASGVLNSKLYVAGGYDGTSNSTNTYRFDGAQWSQGAGLPMRLCWTAGAVVSNAFYAIGGSNGMASTNVFRYFEGSTGAAPASGSYTGGYFVTITGTNLSDGTVEDITNVTLCGVAVSAIVSVSGSTQLVITAGVAPSALVGDVRVCSISHGESVRANLFTYLAPSLSVLGTNGAAIASAEAASFEKGNAFRKLSFGTGATNRLSITNSGNQALAISSYTTGGVASSSFRISGLPGTVSAGGVSNFTVIYTPAAASSHNATLSIVGSDPASPFTLNLAGSCYALSAAAGPFAGGNVITITNGNLGAITNITVGGAPAIIQGSGTDWATIIVPATGSAGPKDIVIETSDLGSTTLANAYTVNPAGTISPNGVTPESGSITGGYPVAISGVNLGNGSDVTNVTLCGVPASLVSQSSTQVVVVADAGNAVGVGDVRIYSIAFGMSTASDAFTYLKGDQSIAFVNPGAQITTNAVGLTATASSALSVSFSVLSGSASIAGGTNLTFSGAGSVSIVASQVGDANWNPAPNITNTFSVAKAIATLTLSDLMQLYDGTPKAATYQTTPSDLSVVLTYNGDSSEPLNAGSYAVTGTVSEALWQAVAVDTLVIVRAGQTIAFPAIPAQTVTSAVGLTATAASALPVSFSVASGPAQIADGTNLTFSGAGQVSIAASQAGNTNWNAASSMTNTFTVIKATATVTLSDLVQPYDGTPKSATATTVPVGLTVDITYNGSATAPTVVGDYVVTGVVNDVAYQGIAFDTLVISKASQTIAFPAIAQQRETNTIGLAATASSFLPVSFAILSGPASITSGTNVAFSAAGQVSIVASQGGDATWNPAPDVTNTFTVLAVYTLTVQASPNGATVPSAGAYNYVDGEEAQLSATAAAYYHFVQWTGDVPPGNETDNPLTVAMNGHKTLGVAFAQNLTTNSGVPQEWLAKYGFTNNFDEAVSSDADNDGVPTGYEWIMNTDPTNSSSFLRLMDLNMADGGNILSWPCATDRVYDVEADLVLLPGAWAPVAGLTNLVPASGWLVVTNGPNDAVQKFHRVKVRLP